MPRGQYDPQRAHRIAAAALDVVAERGVGGLTHRAVAAAAGVPLGSTTYYSKTLDDLLETAMREAKAQTDSELAQLSVDIAAAGEVTRPLAAYLHRTVSDQFGRTVVEFELYLAALRRPQLRVLSQGWGEALAGTLVEHVDEHTAMALSMLCDGLLLKAVVQHRPFREPEILALLRTVANADPVALTSRHPDP